jgi:hypothetical protein
MGEGTKVGEGFNVLRSGIFIRCIKYKAPITTTVVSSNLVQGEVNTIQHYLIKFVSDLRYVGGFLRELRIPFANKTNRHDIT